MAERFILVRAAADGPDFLAWREAPDFSEKWTSNRADARRFTDCGDADAMQVEIVVRDGVAVAVVPDHVSSADLAAIQAHL